MGWFDGKTDCYGCGKEIEKKSAVVRFGKKFCSETHAEQYVNERRKLEAKTSNRNRGGCC